MWGGSCSAAPAPDGSQVPPHDAPLPPSSATKPPPHTQPPELYTCTTSRHFQVLWLTHGQSRMGCFTEPWQTSRWLSALGQGGLTDTVLEHGTGGPCPLWLLSKAASVKDLSRSGPAQPAFPNAPWVLQHPSGTARDALYPAARAARRCRGARRVNEPGGRAGGGSRLLGWASLISGEGAGFASVLLLPSDPPPSAARAAAMRRAGLGKSGSSRGGACSRSPGRGAPRPLPGLTGQRLPGAPSPTAVGVNGEAVKSLPGGPLPGELRPAGPDPSPGRVLGGCMWGVCVKAVYVSLSDRVCADGCRLAAELESFGLEKQPPLLLFFLAQLDSWSSAGMFSCFHGWFKCSVWAVSPWMVRFVTLQSWPFRVLSWFYFSTHVCFPAVFGGKLSSCFQFVIV